MIDAVAPLTEREKAFMHVLSQHKGRERAISVPEMAKAVGVDEREAQNIKRHLVESHGVCIGSSCGRPPGWYQPLTQQEVNATVRQYRHRLISLARLIAKTEQSTPAEILGQLKLQLEGKDA